MLKWNYIINSKSVQQIYNNEVSMDDTIDTAKLQQQHKDIKAAIQNVQSINELYRVKSEYLGKDSYISTLLKMIPSLPDDQRKTFASQLQHFRKLFTEIIDEKQTALDSLSVSKQVDNNVFFDPTIPGRDTKKRGKKHVLTQTIDELTNIMLHLGFKFASAHEIEDEFHNFTALNVPALHPAKNLQDTFYIEQPDSDNRLLLRTHTSSVQIRYMKSHQPPYYIASIGKVYRVDDADQTHLPMFNQLECLCVDKNITLLDMKNTIQNLLKLFFMSCDVPMRFRASYFPFTEPSMEVDIKYPIGDKNGKWLEIMGCGMVHPNVLKNVGIDQNDKYQGFAFGIGVERLAMLKHNIADVRSFIEGDIRWLHHYGV